MKYDNATIVVILVVLVIGLGIGSIATSSLTPLKMEGGAMKENSHLQETHGHNLPHGHSHAHDMMAISENTPVPSVDLIVHDDPKGGWNVQVVLENYELTPEQASLDHIEGEGHAHLYIDGDKITRLYGEWFHLPKEWVTKGAHELKITLSTNDHKELMANGEIISDSETISLGEEK